MPRTEAEGMNHVAFTDHSIPRAAGRRSTADAPGRQLRLFWGGDPGARDLGLAYAELAAKENDTVLYSRSFELLRHAQLQSPRDAKMLVQFATLYDRLGDEDRAMELYEEAAQADPDLISAAINLGSCYAKRGRIPEAMRLWQNALKKNPALETAGLNLGVAQARSGDIAAARTTLQSVLDYNPDSAPARKLLAELTQ
jgi:tetratricopeptide (TPR) repeat protein